MRDNLNKWKSTFNFLKKAKLPWMHFILASIVPFLATYIYVYLPELEGQIAAGEIFDAALIRKYVFLSILLLLLDATSFYSAWVEIQFDRRIQKVTWRKMLLMPMGRFEQEQPSTLISRVTDDSTYVSSLISYILSLVLSLYSAVLMIASLFEMSKKLAAFTVPVMLLNFIFAFAMRKRGYNVGYSIQQALSRYTSFLSERVSQIPLLKAMGTEDEELVRGCKLSDERRKAELRAQWYEILIAIVMEVTNILIVGSVLIGGSMLVKGGSMRMDSLIAFYILAMSLPNTLQELLFQMLKMEQYRGAVEVISEISEAESERKGGETEFEGLQNAIEFKDVSFSYKDGSEEVLSSVSFEIPKGKTTAVIGPTGSGKTTILKLLERFYDADSGDVFCDGRAADEYNIDSWRKRFGYIVQNSPLMTGTIRSNILYGAKRDYSDDELMEIAKRVKLDGFIRSLDKGLDAPIDGNGVNISGGQRQRIAIARALAAEPDILIMDEATSNLDAVNVKAVNEALREIMKDRTVVVVAHQMSTIKHADKIIVMDRGSVQAEGSHDELIKQDGYYSRYCKLQGAV